MSEIYEVKDSITESEPGFELGRLPLWAYKYLSLRSSRDGRRMELDVGPYVGSIPLAHGGTLYITPRAGQAAFARMLVKTEDVEESILRGDELSIYGTGGTGEIWLKLLSRPYIDKLRQIEKESLAFSRERKYDRLNYVRGRLEVLPTVLALASHSSRPVHSHYRSRTYDTPENRVLAAAAEKLIHLGIVHNGDRFLTAMRWAKRLKGGRLQVEDLQHITAGLARGHYHGARAYYAPALLTARLIIAQTGLVLARENPVEAEPLLVNVSTLFERYVRRILNDELRDCFVGQAGKGSRFGNNRTLYINGDVEMKPDVLAQNPEGICLVIDAKYKPDGTISSDDHYQMASYLAAYESRVGLFIRPTDANTLGSTKVVRTAYDERRVIELALSLSRPIEAERQLANLVRIAFRLSRRLTAEKPAPSSV